jgi:dipeptidyl aminopeptidase/acylaminoacyl peptidase
MRNVKTPILIIHGEADERVPLSQAVAFYRACIHNNVPVKMVTYPREGHIYMERKHVIDMWMRMKQFYDLHLG